MGSISHGFHETLDQGLKVETLEHARIQDYSCEWKKFQLEAFNTRMLRLVVQSCVDRFLKLYHEFEVEKGKGNLVDMANFITDRWIVEMSIEDRQNLCTLHSTLQPGEYFKQETSQHHFGLDTPTSQSPHPLPSSPQSVSDNAPPLKKRKISVPIMKLGAFLRYYLSPAEMECLASACFGQTTVSDADKLCGQLCLVCGGRSTGLHYGKMTCEGCKGFFKRAVQSRHLFKCTGPLHDSCNIMLDRRNSCKRCRFRKCLLTGMAPRAVRKNHMPGGRNNQSVYAQDFEESDDGLETADSKSQTSSEVSPALGEVTDSDPVHNYSHDAYTRPRFDQTSSQNLLPSNPFFLNSSLAHTELAADSAFQQTCMGITRDGKADHKPAFPHVFANTPTANLNAVNFSSKMSIPDPPRPLRILDNEPSHKVFYDIVNLNFYRKRGAQNLTNYPLCHDLPNEVTILPRETAAPVVVENFRLIKYFDLKRPFNPNLVYQPIVDLMCRRIEAWGLNFSLLRSYTEILKPKAVLMFLLNSMISFMDGGDAKQRSIQFFLFISQTSMSDIINHSTVFQAILQGISEMEGSSGTKFLRIWRFSMIDCPCGDDDRLQTLSANLLEMDRLLHEIHPQFILQIICLFYELHNIM